MNSVLEEMRKALSYLGIDIQKDGTLMHYGRSKLDGAPGVGSGRYPLGSGEDDYQHRGDFVSRVKQFKKNNPGAKEIDIARAVGCKTTGEYRKKYSIAMNEQKNTMRKAMLAMLKDGKSQAEVSRHFGVPESTLRSMIDADRMARSSAAQNLANDLKAVISEKQMIDVSKGVELELNVTRGRLENALKILEDEGYHVYRGGVPQVTNPGKQTTQTVLCDKDVPYKDIYDYDKVQSISDYIVRQGPYGMDRLERTFEYPASMDISRLKVRFRDEVGPDGHTGIEKDGTMEIRRGVADLDLGNSHYAQVRILVDGDRYLKGMAYYSDDLPDGVDIVFNTNKKPMPYRDVLKPIENNPTNPFGALIKEKGGQYHYIDENGVERLGLINKKSDEGDWGEWSKELPSQFLSKQPLPLIQKQLNMTMADKQAEFEEIMSLTNPTVKKALLRDFAGKCDATAEDLSAAALPRQAYQVLLPLPTISDNQVYAPQFRDGETVALIRYPHAGTFEIPIVTVNNKNSDGIRIFGKNPKDMVGVSKAVADRLSGADFDGDTVMVIPCNSDSTNVRIQSTKALEGLKDFDPKDKYGSRVEVDANGNEHYYCGAHEFKPLKKGLQTELEMGKVSNLITDMTLKGAPPDEIIRAVRHSMTVIDAPKHKLDWKQSEIDEGIAALKRRYQERFDEDGNPHYGASTLISRSKGEVDVDKRQGSPRINEKGKPWYDPSKPEGANVYKTADDLIWVDKKGKEHKRTQKSSQMMETTDAHKLSSGTRKEEVYADYANWLKAKANEARMEIIRTGNLKYDPAAKKKYAEEVNSLMSQLNEALLNGPRELHAQRAANAEVKAMMKSNPGMSKKEQGKREQQALQKYRVLYGAKRHPISITERMWEAIQAGAITEAKLTQILRFADGAKVREYSMPKQTSILSVAKQAKARSMLRSGYSYREVADLLGVSKSTIENLAKPAA